jgi:hypothetical protein
MINGNTYIRDLTPHPADRQVSPVGRVPSTEKHSTTIRKIWRYTYKAFICRRKLCRPNAWRASFCTPYLILLEWPHQDEWDKASHALREIKKAYEFWLINLKGKVHRWNLGARARARACVCVCVWMIMLGTHVGETGYNMWGVFKCLRIEFNGGLLWTWWWTYGFNIKRGISRSSQLIINY